MDNSPTLTHDNQLIVNNITQKKPLETIREQNPGNSLLSAQQKLDNIQRQTENGTIYSEAIEKKEMNELNRTTKQNKTEITNTKNQHNTTKATSNLPLDPTLWKKHKYDMGVWSKIKFKTKYNLYNNQSPILMLYKLPSPIHIPPQELKLSTQSTISNITSEKQYRRKVNKVDEFLPK